MEALWLFVSLIVYIMLCVVGLSAGNNQSADNKYGKEAPSDFEKAFQKRMGRSPVAYLRAKIEAGSDMDSVRYLFGVLEAEISKKSKCCSRGFDYYYQKAMQLQMRKTVEDSSEGQPVSPESVVSKDFAKSQMIGKDRFLQQYGRFLQQLASDPDFMEFVQVLRQKLSGKEVTDTQAANRCIADYFYENRANERFPVVADIVLGVLSYGKQASAHISIYYAMYFY